MFPPLGCYHYKIKYVHFEYKILTFCFNICHISHCAILVYDQLSFRNF